MFGSVFSHTCVFRNKGSWLTLGIDFSLSNSEASASQKSMYPRVKVRVQKEEDDQYAYESLPSLKAFESLSISDISSSDDSPTSVVRIPRACILSPDRHGLPSSRGRTKDNNQNIFGGSKTNARASSVPRPRAVLSSPDNDQMISTRSKTKAEVLSGLKNHNSCQNRHHIKCKIFPKSIPDSCHTSGNKGTKETDVGKLDSRARARLVKGDPSRRTHLQEGDQHSVRSKVKQ